MKISLSVSLRIALFILDPLKSWPPSPGGSQKFLEINVRNFWPPLWFHYLNIHVFYIIKDVYRHVRIFLGTPCDGRNRLYRLPTGLVIYIKKINKPIFKISNISPTAACILVSLSEKIRGQTFPGVSDVWFWSCLSTKLTNDSCCLQLQTPFANAIPRRAFQCIYGFGMPLERITGRFTHFLPEGKIVCQGC